MESDRRIEQCAYYADSVFISGLLVRSLFKGKVAALSIGALVEELVSSPLPIPENRDGCQLLDVLSLVVLLFFLSPPSIAAFFFGFFPKFYVSSSRQQAAPRSRQGRRAAAPGQGEGPNNLLSYIY